MPVTLPVCYLKELISIFSQKPSSTIALNPTTQQLQRILQSSSSSMEDCRAENVGILSELIARSYGISFGPLRPLLWRKLLRTSNPLEDYLTQSTPFDALRSTNSIEEQQSEAERIILHQLALDMPRHHSALYHIPELSSRIERMLFLWAIAHPSIGYVQGIDDIVVAFFTVFLTEQLAIAFDQSRVRPSLSIPQPFSEQDSVVADALLGELCSASTESTELANVSLLAWSRSDAVFSALLSCNKSSLQDTDSLFSIAWTQFIAPLQLASISSDPMEQLLTLLSFPFDESRPDCSMLDRAECHTFYTCWAFLEHCCDHFAEGMPGAHACVQRIHNLLDILSKSEPLCSRIVEQLTSVGIIGTTTTPRCQSTCQQLTNCLTRVVGLDGFLYKWIHLLLLRELAPPTILLSLQQRHLDVLIAATALGNHPVNHRNWLVSELTAKCTALLLCLCIHRRVVEEEEDWMLILQNPVPTLLAEMNDDTGWSCWLELSSITQVLLTAPI